MMRLSAAQALRPKTLDEMIGHDKWKPTIKKYMEQERQQWLFTGSTGTGKTTLAHIVARHFRDGVNDDQILDWNCGTFRGVSTLQSLVEDVQVYPMHGKYRVIILDEAQLLTPDAKSLLLKELENEASCNVWILCTMDVDSIHKALRDRCASFHLNGMGRDERRQLALRVLEYLSYTGETAKLMRGMDGATHMVSAREVVSAVENFCNGMSVEDAMGGTH